MQPALTLFLSLAIPLGLSACGQTVSQTSASVMGLQGISSVQRAAQAEPSSADLSMSCAAVSAELTRLYARMDEINRSERARERKASLTGGLLDAGLSVLGAGAIANAGSARAVANTATATTLAGTALSGATSSGPRPQTLNEALAITERSAVLERVRLARKC